MRLHDRATITYEFDLSIKDDRFAAWPPQVHEGNLPWLSMR